MPRKASDPPGETANLLLNVHNESRVLFVGLTLSHDGHPRAAELLVQKLQHEAPRFAVLAATDSRHCNTLFVASFVPVGTTKGVAKKSKHGGSKRKQGAVDDTAQAVDQHVSKLKEHIQRTSETIPGAPVFFVGDGASLWGALEQQKSWNWMTPRDLADPAASKVAEVSVHSLKDIPKPFISASLENAVRERLCSGLGFNINLQGQCTKPAEAWHLRQLQAASVEVSPALKTDDHVMSFVCRIHACVRRLVPPAADKVKTILNRRRKEARKKDLHDNEAFKAATAAGKLFKSQRTMGTCQVLDMNLMCESDTVVEMLPTLEPVRLLRFFWGSFPESSALQNENRRRGFSLYEPMTEEEFWAAETELGAVLPPTPSDSLVAEVQLLSGFGGTTLVSTARLTHACPILRCASRLQAPQMLAEAIGHVVRALDASSKLSWLAPPDRAFVEECDLRSAVAGIQQDASHQPHFSPQLEAGAPVMLGTGGSPVSAGSLLSLSQGSDLDLASDDDKENLAGTAVASAGSMFVSAKAALPVSCQLNAVGGTKPAFRCFATQPAAAAGFALPPAAKRAAPQLSSIKKRAFLGTSRK